MESYEINKKQWNGKGEAKRWLCVDDPTTWLCQISWTSLLPQLRECGPKSPKKRLLVTE